MALVAILFCSTIVLVTTQTPSFTRKLLMAALNPAALFWLGYVRSRTAGAIPFSPGSLALVLAGLCLGIGSNGLVGRWAIHWLSATIRVRSVKSEPLDTLIVVGGGLGARTDRTPRLSGSGDRVMLAARLYHLGKASLLITGGDAIPRFGLPALAGSTFFLLNLR